MKEIECEKVFFENLRENNFTEENKKKIFEYIERYSLGTKKMKERFLLYYNLIKGQEKRYTYKQIGEIYNCSGESIRDSIKQFKSYLLRKQNFEEKCQWLVIFNDCRNQKGLKKGF